MVLFVGFNALVHGLSLGVAPLSRHPILAFVLVNFAAGWVAYVGMRTWAFQDRDVRHPVTGMVRFFTLGALTMVIPVVCLWISRYVLGLTTPLADNLSANVVGLESRRGRTFLGLPTLRLRRGRGPRSSQLAGGIG